MSDVIHARLETQLQTLDVVLARAAPTLIDWRPASGDWCRPRREAACDEGHRSAG